MEILPFPTILFQDVRTKKKWIGGFSCESHFAPANCMHCYTLLWVTLTIEWRHIGKSRLEYSGRAGACFPERKKMKRLRLWHNDSAAVAVLRNIKGRKNESNYQSSHGSLDCHFPFSWLRSLRGRPVARIYIQRSRSSSKAPCLCSHGAVDSCFPHQNGRTREESAGQILHVLRAP